MQHSIIIKNEDFMGLKNKTQNMIIIQEELDNNEKIYFINQKTKEKMLVEITSKNSFNSLNDVFKIIPYELFGEYTSIDEALEKIEIDNDKIINVYRINHDNDKEIIIKDKNLRELLNLDSLKEINIGRSVSRVFEGTLKNNNKKIILKIQTLNSRNSLKKEYEKIKWLQGKINCPQIYYWSEIGMEKYLVMEFKEGKPSFKFNNIGYHLGKEMRKIHEINIDSCLFYDNEVDILLKNCIEKIDAIFPEIQKNYSYRSIEEVIEFLMENKPNDRVLVHGDYSLPNILIDNDNRYNFIDLGDISISTKYFDFYYFIRSLKINKKTEEIEQFKKGYGISDFEDKYLKWMDIIDKSLY